jgi:uncharacterized protein (UPF0332 family)
MNPDFKKCLENRKIVPSSNVKRLISKELEAAREDYREACDSLNKGAHKWSTIQSYYSMFHSARALLYNKGYKERSHFCLAVALDALYVESKLLLAKYSNAFRKAMSLREDADYSLSFSKEGAKAITQSAEEFLKQAENLLKQYVKENQNRLL